MVQRAATHIARKAVEMDIVPGRSPISVAAAAIYMASQVSFFALLSIFGCREMIVGVNYRHPNTKEVKRKLVTLPEWLTLLFANHTN